MEKIKREQNPNAFQQFNSNKGKIHFGDSVALV